jgi:hypothetical protein
VLVFGLGLLVTIPAEYDKSNDFTPTGATPLASIAITNATELQNMSSDLDADYYLANDIDCTNTSNWNGGKGFIPIGNKSNIFNGTFDGRSYKIINLYFNVSDYFCGLFGYTNTTVKISNVTLVNFTIISGADYCGGLVGFNQGTIINCHANGSVEGSSYIGGLIGQDFGGSILNCSSSGYLIGFTDYCGGLAGYLEDSFVNNCISSSTVNGTEDVGGLIGAAYGSIYINNSYSIGTINGTSDWIGGFIGYLSEGTINNSFSTGDIFANISVGPNYVGGFAGENNEKIINSYATGNVLGPGSVGGFVGLNSGLNAFIKNCYANGDVTGTQFDIGGLVGYNTGAINYCHSSGNVTGGTKDRVGGLVGYNNGPVTNCESYGITYGEHWFVGGLIGMNFGDVSNCTSYGNTTASGVGSIVLYGGLMGQNNGIVLNCSSYGYTYSTSGNYFGGLMGRNSGTVKESHAYGNTGLNNNWVGGLVGENMAGAVIENCSSIGIVTGNTHVGGLVGYNLGEVMRSYSTGDTIGTKNVGGLIGINFNGMVTDCYSQSKISGADLVGGLVGNNTATSTITNCYSNGSVNGTTNLGGLIGNNTATVTNCFWDNETSGQLTSDGGTGMNTTEMKKGATFKNANWNFTFPWGIVQGKTYPFLEFFYNPPRIITKSLDPAIEDLPYLMDLEGYVSPVPAENELNGFMTTNAGAWLSLGPGYLFGTPTNDDLGVFWVNITIFDLLGNTDSKNYSLSVFNTNDPPDILTEELENATEDELFSFVFSGTDVDPTGDTIHWSIQSNVGDWLRFNNTSGELNGTPTNDDVGTYWINMTILDDKTASQSKNFSFIVLNTNDEPMILTENVGTAHEDQIYNVDYEAIDIDPTNDILTWTLLTDANWLGINSGTGLLAGTPTNDHVGSYWVNVSLDDGSGGTDWRNFSLTVYNVNDPPIIPIQKLENATEDQLYYTQMTAIDIDPTGDIFNWSVKTSDNSNWLTINDTTGNLTGIPTNDDVGLIWVNVSVSDGNGGLSSRNYTLIIENTNDPPEIITNPIDTAEVDDHYENQYEGFDSDPTGDMLYWSLNTNATWLNIDQSTGELTGTPQPDDAGTFWVNVTVSDGKGGFDWQNFTLKVLPRVEINLDPIITTQDRLTAEVGKIYSVDYDATDDRTALSNLIWSLETNATWLELDISTGELSGTPNANQVGIYWVQVTVSDGEGGSASTNFSLTVKGIPPINEVPELTNGKMTPSTGDTDTEFTFTVIYTDDENEPGDVHIWIDGDRFEMTPDVDDTDYTDGVKYTYQTKLDKGTHEYYFTGTDGTNGAVSGDTTPTSAGEAGVTSEIEELDKKEESDDNFMLYILLIIIVIIILVILAFALTRKKAVAGEDLFADEEAEEPMDDLAEDELEDEEFEDVEEPEVTEELVEEEPEDEGEIEDSAEEENEKAGEDEEDDEEDEYECPDCGAALDEDDDKCKECGAEFE